MKSLGIQIENQQLRFALVEHRGSRLLHVTLDEYALNKAYKLAKIADRIILGLPIAGLRHRVVETKMLNDAQNYYSYYSLNKNKCWQELSAKKTWIDSLLSTLKQQGLRIRAIDCQILAAMRLSQFNGLARAKKQLWQLIEPNTISVWQSHFLELEHCSVFYYQQNSSQLDEIIAEYKQQLNFQSEISIHYLDSKLNPLIGLALWNVI